VAKHFTAVFKQLVPHGDGELVMQTSRDVESQPDTQADSQDDSEVGDSLHDSPLLIAFLSGLGLA
jgi:chromosome segregation ATPase